MGAAHPGCSEGGWTMSGVEGRDAASRALRSHAEVVRQRTSSSSCTRSANPYRLLQSGNLPLSVQRSTPPRPTSANTPEPQSDPDSDYFPIISRAVGQSGASLRHHRRLSRRCRQRASSDSVRGVYLYSNDKHEVYSNGEGNYAFDNCGARLRTRG
ncbi:hypothetical protein B0H13DRAFT_1182292 [Mycena leptocephala]|nr:hypothetical protein B0H13DRAFT_1182292 [Mycena leptocephala]